MATLHGLPIGFALTGAKADERQVLLDLLHADRTLADSRPGQVLIGDKNYYGRDFQADLPNQGISLLRRARKGEPERPGGKFFKPLAADRRVHLRRPQRATRPGTTRRA